MRVDSTFLTGVIAVREKEFLGDKIYRLSEMPDVPSAYRLLRESGFGGTEDDPSFTYEDLIAYEEKRTDDFIRENANSLSEREYLLAERDFHNAKALYKSLRFSLDQTAMLAPEGVYSREILSEKIASRKYDGLNGELVSAFKKADELFDKDNLTGATLGAIFVSALYERLFAVCKGSLKKLVVKKADMQNLVTLLRAEDAETAKAFFVPFGTLKENKLLSAFKGDEEAKVRAFNHTPYEKFWKDGLKEKEKGSLTEAERKLASVDVKFYAEKRFELQKNEPFLYYVLRRRTECMNVRIVFVGLAAGLTEHEIFDRLRGD